MHLSRILYYLENRGQDTVRFLFFHGARCLMELYTLRVPRLPSRIQGECKSTHCCFISAATTLNDGHSKVLRIVVSCDTIEGLNIAKGASSAAPAKAVFGTAAIVLSMIRVSSLSIPVCRWIVGQCLQDSMANRKDYIKLGQVCGDVCKVLER